MNKMDTVQMNERMQKAKEEYLCLSALVTGMCLGVLIALWSDMEDVERGVFIFLACVLVFMTCAFKTAKVTSFISGKDAATNEDESEDELEYKQ